MNIDDSILFNNQISARALKVLLYIMRVKEKGDAELFGQKMMRKYFKEGRDSVRMAIKELEQNGYIIKEQTRVGAGAGEKFGVNDFQIVQEKLI